MNRLTIALAGNPNVGKSTVFNTLTGLRQHTGNWAGKTVETARGTFHTKQHVCTLVDWWYVTRPVCSGAFIWLCNA